MRSRDNSRGIGLAYYLLCNSNVPRPVPLIYRATMFALFYPLIERRLPLSVLCQLPWPLSARPLSTLPSVALSFSSDLLDVNIIGCRALLTTLLSCRRYLPIALTASGPPEFGGHYLANDVAFSSEVYFHPRRPLSVFVNGRRGFRGYDLVDSAFLS